MIECITAIGLINMKRAQFYRRIRTLWNAIRDYFIEEEPHEKARRLMKDAAGSLQKIIYQRVALEYEVTTGKLDHESQKWCDENLQQLMRAESVMSEQLGALREQYRKLMLKDLFYKSIGNPSSDVLEAAQMSILELEAAVEAERRLRALPQLLDASFNSTDPDEPKHPHGESMLQSKNGSEWQNGNRVSVFKGRANS